MMCRRQSVNNQFVLVRKAENILGPVVVFALSTQKVELKGDAEISAET